MVELGNLRKDRNIKIMCGRYVLYSKEKFKNKYNININPNYNISPNQEVFVIDQNMNITKLKWGIRAEWKKSLIINAFFHSALIPHFSFVIFMFWSITNTS